MKLAARMQKKQWHIYPDNPDTEKLAAAVKIPPLLAQVLLNRNISDPDQATSFLSPKLSDLIEPEQMPGITEAASRLKQAIIDREKIAIYGDYDVDGITATSILYELIKLLGSEADFYIPHRIDEGYGLNEAAIQSLADNGATLIITVDCGITAIQSAALAKQLGVDMIITDHHQPGKNIPEAAAIVHPLIDPDYPNPYSAGAMVAFKLAWATANLFKNGSQTPSHLRQFLLNATSLAAMGTIADVVDIRGENRILTNFGLQALPNANIKGIKALIDSAGLSGETIDSYHIGFRLAPMLNAAGRMGHARLAVELLTSDSDFRCFKIAEYLKQQNNQRRTVERNIFKQVCEMITTAGLDHPDRKTIVLESEQWHTGVIGIVASRVIDKYYRPTILINTSNGIGQGSGRSVEGFNLYEAINTCSSHVSSFGGHEMAAGLKIEKENIADFAKALEAYAHEHLSEQAIISRMDIDAVCSICDFDMPLVRQLKNMEPFGPGNPKPLFASNGVRLISPPRRCGSRNEHLQISITDNTASVRCIGFGMGQLEKKLLETEYFNIAYEVDINHYNGNSSIQFVLSDIQFE